MNFELLVDLHKANARQGPGGEEQTRLALSLAGLSNVSKTLQVADIGCGTGASTLVLAKSLKAKITAVDLFQDFLDILTANAEKQGLAEKITTLACSMEELPFKEGSLDVIWSEGAIYNMGFEKGVKYFKRFLKSGGILAVSEVTWLTQKRPEELRRYWDAEYPEITTATENLRILEEHGFVLKGYFPLPESCWIDNYYNASLENSFAGFVAKHGSEDARAIVEAEKVEIAFYKKYRDYYSYGFYVVQL